MTLRLTSCAIAGKLLTHSEIQYLIFKTAILLLAFQGHCED